MGQFVFFAIFVITLLVGAFYYFIPEQSGISPLKFFMNISGYNTQRDVNTKMVQQLDKTRSKGLVKSREEMDDNAQRQNDLLDKVRDQQQLLNETGKDSTDMEETQQEARQKAQDMQETSEQRIEDQQQRMQDENR